MTPFVPLGNFRATMPIPDALVAKGKAFLSQLPDVPNGSFFERIYLHWTGWHMNCLYPEYVAEVANRGGLWSISITGNPMATAKGDKANEAAATWRRNAHSFPIALAGMYGANPRNFGREPVTIAGIDNMLVAAAAVGRKYAIDLTGTVQGHDAYSNRVVEPTLMTHAEVAIVDSYYPGDLDPTTQEPATDTRFDFAICVPLPEGVPLEKSFANVVGDEFRLRAHALKERL